ncbi:MAG: hypothetical protein WBG86_01115 [Polyangiales bacterium]
MAELSRCPALFLASHGLPDQSSIVISFNGRTLAFLFGVFATILLLGKAVPVSAQDSPHAQPQNGGTKTVGSPEHEYASAPTLSYELRAELFSASNRWSHITQPFIDDDIAARSLYFTVGLGLRVFTERGHGLLLDGQYRFDSDFDGVAQEQSEPVRFGVAHVGYAYRYVARRSLRSRRTWAITPHGALSGGAAIGEFDDIDGIPRRSPVFGARVGIDFDLHIHRFFLGWGLSYEILRHTKGVMTRSSFFAWSVIPIFRMGVNFGRRI